MYLFELYSRNLPLDAPLSDLEKCARIYAEPLQFLNFWSSLSNPDDFFCVVSGIDWHDCYNNISSFKRDLRFHI